MSKSSVIYLRTSDDVLFVSFIDMLPLVLFSYLVPEL